MCISIFYSFISKFPSSQCLFEKTFYSARHYKQLCYSTFNWFPSWFSAKQPVKYSRNGFWGYFQLIGSDFVEAAFGTKHLIQKITVGLRNWIKLNEIFMSQTSKKEKTCNNWIKFFFVWFFREILWILLVIVYVWNIICELQHKQCFTALFTRLGWFLLGFKWFWGFGGI